MSKHLNPFCFLLLTLVPLIFGCVVDNPKSNINQTQEIAMNQSNEKHETATFGAGCFWCVEAVYQNLKGVQKVVSGYAGGKTPNPTYKQICTNTYFTILLTADIYIDNGLYIVHKIKKYYGIL